MSQDSLRSRRRAGGLRAAALLPSLLLLACGSTASDSDAGGTDDAGAPVAWDLGGNPVDSRQDLAFLSDLASPPDLTLAICPAGSYCPGDGGGPMVCPAGSCCGPGSSVPTKCAMGFYCPAGSAMETPCAAGTWDNDGDPATPCVAWSTCAMGTAELKAGTTTADRVCTSDCTKFATAQQCGALATCAWSNNACAYSCPVFQSAPACDAVVSCLWKNAKCTPFPDANTICSDAPDQQHCNLIAHADGCIWLQDAQRCVFGG